MKNSIFLFLFLIVNVSIQCQTPEINTLLNFEDKTIRLCLNQVVENEPEIQIVTVWDKHFLDLVADPMNNNNTVMHWERSIYNQKYGGIAFVVSDVQNGLNAKAWDYFSYKIWVAAPIKTSLLKLVKHGDIPVYEDSQIINLEPNKWHTVKHPLNESLFYEDVNPIGIMIFPAGGEDMEGVVLIDDIKLERYK